MKTYITMEQVDGLATHLASRIRDDLGYQQKVFGVPRGGVPVAFAVVSQLNWFSCVNNLAASVPVSSTVVNTPEEATVIVDDLVDSGATAQKYGHARPFYALIDKRTDMTYKGKWIVFPWEQYGDGREETIDENIVRILQYIGEDTTREGLRETPARVVAAMREWFGGYSQKPEELVKLFRDGAKEKSLDEMVMVAGIPFFSHCEHHMAPFFGVIHVGYIPGKKIVGLSKVSRVVDCFAHRLQVQERLTGQIADTLEELLEARGVAVLVKARHFCMESRGIRTQGSTTITSAMRGNMLMNHSARAEFLALIQGTEKSF